LSRPYLFDWNTISKEYDNGMTTYQLGKKYNVHPTTIGNNIKQFNVLRIPGKYIRSDNQKRMISLANKGRKRTPEHLKIIKNILSKFNQAGNKNIQWKGGIADDGRGYKLIYLSPRKYKLEHRLVIEKQIGRELHSWEIIHHINENRSDNRIENLRIVTRTEHRKLHKKEHKNVTV